MKLTKTVPARKVTFEAIACRLDWIAMSQKFRDIRSKCRTKMDKCQWCQHSFDDGEMMALAIANSGNKVLCRSCGEKLLASVD